MSIRALWRAQWNPWERDHGTAKRIHAGRWPAQYGGLVWIKLKPQPDSVGQEHTIELDRVGTMGTNRNRGAARSRIRALDGEGR